MEKLLLSACVSGKEIVIPDLVENNLPKWFSNETPETSTKDTPRFDTKTQRADRKYYQESNKQKPTYPTVSQDVMNGNPVAKCMCPDLHSLLKLYLTILVTTATAEKTFSTMRRLKTYLRSSMSQEASVRGLSNDQVKWYQWSPCCLWDEIWVRKNHYTVLLQLS